MKYCIFIALILGSAYLILISGFVLPTVVALLIFILAIASDFYTTWKCLKMKGREGNPIMAFLFRRIGVYKAFGLMVGAWACLIIFRWLPAVEGVQTSIALVYWLVPINNLIVLTKLSRKSYA